jgi:two-component system cell cycle sensor histidine kinase PleC
MSLFAVPRPYQLRAHAWTNWTKPVSAALAIFALAAGAARADHPNPRSVIVGTVSERPITFIDRNDEWAGLSVDILNVVAAQHGWRVTRVRGTWSDLLKKLERSEIDLLEGVAYSAERERLYELSTEPLTNNWAVVYTRSGAHISSLPELKGKRVAVSEHSVHTNILRQMAREFGVVFTVINTPGFREVLKTVAEGKAEAGVVSRTFGRGQAPALGLVPTPVVFNPTEVRYAAPKGKNRDLLDAIDAYLVAARADPESVYSRSLRRWMEGPDEFEVPEWLRWAAGMSVAALVLALFAMAVLRHQVRARTAALQESIDRFRDVAEIGGDWIWEMGPDLRFTYLSPRFYELFPVKPKDIVGKTRAEIATDPEDEAWRRHIEDLKARRPFRNFQCSITVGNCQPHHIRTSGRPVFGADGAFKGYRGTSTDISERRQAEEALRDSERRYRTLVELSPDAIYVHCDGVLMFINQAGARFFGARRGPGDLIGRSLKDLIHPDQWEEAQIRIRAVLEDKNTTRLTERKFVGLDGRQIQAEVCGTPFVFQGRPAALVVARDITARRQAEEALRDSEQRFRTLVESTNVVAWEMDVETWRITYVSPHAASLLGYPQEEWLTDGFWVDHIHPADRETALGICREALERGEDRDFEYRMTTADGDVIWLRNIVTVVKDAGAPISLRGFMIDINARRRAEENMRRAKEVAEMANRAKSEFLANISHELRTPLNSILGFSEIIKGKLLGRNNTSKYDAYAADIYESGRHLLGLINDILDVSKIEVGEMDVADQEVDVRETVNTCARMMRERADKAQVSLKVLDGYGNPVLKADGRRLKQILLNLLSNAVKFTPPHGRVEIGARRADNGGIDFFVVDTGIGIAPEHIADVVKPFNQVAPAATRSHDGTGLGLFLVKALSELHDGTLSIESTVGAGTRVTVHFPASRVVAG